MLSNLQIPAATTGQVPDPPGEAVQDWLFLILRYAVSRQHRDRQAILDMAEKMDTLGEQTGPCAFRFFRTLSVQVCDAVLAPGHPAHRLIIMAHARRIDEPRLRQVFLLTCRLDSNKDMPTVESYRKPRTRADLWSGPRKC
jgi:hypothetical protein